MDTKARKLLLVALLLSVASIVLSAYSWSQASRLSLPFPKVIAIISLALPLITTAAFTLSARLFKKLPLDRFDLPSILAYLSTIFPIILLVFSLVYGIPTSLLSCSLENQWSYLFRNHDEHSIRAIQNALRCCGLNSMRDRAWPFPRNGVTAGECERTQGYNIRCMDVWRRQESTVASLAGLANIVNWILIALLIYIIHLRQQNSQTTQFFSGEGNADLTTRLLGGTRVTDEEIEEQSQTTRGQVYSDVAESDEGSR